MTAGSDRTAGSENRSENKGTERASKSFMVKITVPVFLGFDHHQNHHFHPSQSQEVELFGWYDPSTTKIDLMHGINTYTQGPMSQGWLDALMKDESWGPAIEKLVRSKLGFEPLAVATTIPAPVDDEDDNGHDEPYDNTHEYD